MTSKVKVTTHIDSDHDYVFCPMCAEPLDDPVSCSCGWEKGGMFFISDDELFANPKGIWSQVIRGSEPLKGGWRIEYSAKRSGYWFIRGDKHD